MIKVPKVLPKLTLAALLALAAGLKLAGKQPGRLDGRESASTDESEAGKLWDVKLGDLLSWKDRPFASKPKQPSVLGDSTDLGGSKFNPPGLKYSITGENRGRAEDFLASTVGRSTSTSGAKKPFNTTKRPATHEEILTAAAVASGMKVYTWALSDDPDFNAVDSYLSEVWPAYPSGGFNTLEQEHEAFLEATIIAIDEAERAPAPIPDDAPPPPHDTYPNACGLTTMTTFTFLPAQSEYGNSDPIEFGETPDRDAWGMVREIETNTVEVEYCSNACEDTDTDDCVDSAVENAQGASINKAMSASECTFIKQSLNEGVMKEYQKTGSEGDHLSGFVDDPFCENIDFKRGLWWSVDGPNSKTADINSRTFQSMVAGMAFGFSSFNTPTLAFCDYGRVNDAPLVIYELELSYDEGGRALRTLLDATPQNGSLTEFLTSWRALVAPATEGAQGVRVTPSAISFRADDELVTLEGQDALELIASCSESIIDP
ncbi:MAG: hypothetical protein IPI35_06280 [Deltaproteobacteria bacterium]|nr:hypothetical protein [Deltaproteobacteria bacterium]